MEDSSQDVLNDVQTNPTQLTSAKPSAIPTTPSSPAAKPTGSKNPNFSKQAGLGALLTLIGFPATGGAVVAVSESYDDPTKFGLLDDFGKNLLAAIVLFFVVGWFNLLLLLVGYGIGKAILPPFIQRIKSHPRIVMAFFILLVIDLPRILLVIFVLSHA